MRAGLLRQRISIQQPSETKEETFGENQQTWTTFASVWARYIGKGGRELWRAQQSAPDLTNLWEIRWMGGITPKMRVRFEDRHGDVRVFGIVAVQDGDERGRMLHLHCIEEV